MSFPSERPASIVFEANPSCLNRRLYRVSDADDFISVHAVHWLVCIETYQSPKRRALDFAWSLHYDGAETCVYMRNTRPTGREFIIGFRGTKSPLDFYDDALIALSVSYPRAASAIEFVSSFMRMEPDGVFQLCGHSLGGEIARAVGKHFGLPVVTFNAASPPTAPAVAGSNEIDYHIVYDIISAWQGPNTVRIDKGFRPLPTRWWERFTYYTWLSASFTDILESHKLKNFSNERFGRVICGEEETLLMRKWLSSLPAALKKFVYFAVFGVSGSFGLPPMEGCYGIELNQYDA